MLVERYWYRERCRPGHFCDVSAARGLPTLPSIRASVSHRCSPNRKRALHVMAAHKPMVVLGSANADLVFSVARLPLAGETMSASGLETLPGGKVRRIIQLEISHIVLDCIPVTVAMPPCM